MADPSTRKVEAPTYYFVISPENCMKLKLIEPEGRATLASLLGSANAAQIFTFLDPPPLISIWIISELQM